MRTSTPRSSAPSLARSLPALALGLVLTLTACGDEGAGSGGGAASAADSAAATGTGLDVTLAEGWVKAADTGMTGVFGTLVNDTGADIQLVSATSPAAERAEIHETVPGEGSGTVMREKAEGIVVPAGGEYVLEPGGDHLMLMGLREPVLPGAEVSLVLTAEGGATVEVAGVARSFAGGNESYAGGHGAGTGQEG